jgi:bifunctional UDP-N-acetylglucosamine pyrophosphorylase/glucosamine-1-phosphate N-acetyltransferase
MNTLMSQDVPPTSATPAAAVILAAGKGTRMKSSLPKPLHEVGGLSLLGHAMGYAQSFDPQCVAVVVGHGGEKVADAARAIRPDAHVAEQEPQLGTAHAVLAARAALEGFAGDVFVLYADTPFIRPETLAKMAEERRKGAAVVVLGFEAADPAGYGRLVVDNGQLEAIIEEKEADAAQKAIRLCNSGVMCIDGAQALALLDRVRNDNAKGEYYLTDIVGLARLRNLPCAVVTCEEVETLGVNSRADLAVAESALQERLRAEAMASGATLIAAETVFFSADTKIAPDVVIEPNVVFGPGVTVESGARIRAFSHLESCHVAEGAVIGPYARLRPGAEIGPGARVGNFVEIKNATLGAGAKANHLTYVGDASIGAGANLGAGTITCNYDGFLKHKTEIGENAFIGSNSALVAPLKIGDGAYVGSGSVVTRDVEADALAISRAKQENKPGLAAKLRARLAAIKAAKKK